MTLTTLRVKDADGNPQDLVVKQTDDGLAYAMISLNSDGTEIADGEGVPVSATSLPLPTGAATSAKQDAQSTILDAIATDVANIPAHPATAENQATEITALSAIGTSLNGIATDQATAANQSTANTALAAIQTSVAAGATAAAQATANTALAAIQTAVTSATPVGSNDIGRVDATGTKVTAANMPAGGVGFLGWLSGIFWQLTQILTVKIDQSTPGTTNAVRAIAGVDGGVPAHSWISDGSTYQVVMKGSGGKLLLLEAFNADTVNHYLRVYNLASNPSGAPVKRILVPPGGYVGKIPTDGESFSTGLSFTYTKGSLADADTTAVGANLAAVNYDHL